MEWYGHQTPLYRKKKFYLPLFILSVMVGLRLLAPELLRWYVNGRLGQFSTTLEGHVDEVDMGIVLGRLQFKGVSGDFKETGERFLQVEQIDSQVSWGSVFSGKPVVDLIIYKADLSYSEKLREVLVSAGSLGKSKGGGGVPKSFRVAKVEVKNSELHLPSLPEIAQEQPVLSKVNATVTNLTPTPDLPRTNLTLRGVVLGTGHIKSAGALELLGQPKKWTVDTELLGFGLPSLNQYLKSKLPFSFNRGTLDLYLEAKSEEGKVVGYLKPFVHGLDVIHGDENLQGVQHWFLEVIAALGNMIGNSDEVAATRVPFIYQHGKISTDTGEALSNAFEYAIQQDVSPGIENSVKLK